MAGAGSGRGNDGKPITKNKLADLLRPAGIAPGHDTTGDDRGYRLSNFTEAFERYLYPLPPGSGRQIVRNINEMGTTSTFQVVRSEMASDDVKGAGNADGISVSDDLTTLIGGKGKEERVSAIPGGNGDKNGGNLELWNPGQSTPATRRPSLSPRAVDHLAHEFFGLKSSAAELEDAIRSQIAKFGVPAEAIGPDVEKVVRRIEALGDAAGTVVNFPTHAGRVPQPAGRAAEPAPYKVLGPAGLGGRCALCGSGVGRRVPKFLPCRAAGPSLPACADKYLAAMADPPVKLPYLGPDPLAEHGRPRAAASRPDQEGESRLRPPAWSDIGNGPGHDDRCAVCGSSAWWSGGETPGWRCATCHPPPPSSSSPPPHPPKERA
jgi:hypothetical protein